MAGKKITRLRELLSRVSVECEAAIGTADELFARNRHEAVKAELALEEDRRKKFGKHPRAPSVWNKADGPEKVRKAKAVSKRKTTVRLVGGKMNTPNAFDLGVEAGIVAAEIAVEGVKKDFAVLQPGDPKPLSPEEFTNARDIVATVSGDNDGQRLLSAGSMTPERWLAEAFPTLTVNRRVKCARFLSAVATTAAESPGENAPDGSTVVENALTASGMTYVEFENARLTDTRFDDAQAAIKAARKRCIMDRLEETLQNRALYGQVEETVDRFGQRHEARRIDNNLAFNLLKYGHEQYIKQNIKDKAVAGAMTMMIAQNHYPPPSAREPKQAEVIDV